MSLLAQSVRADEVVLWIYEEDLELLPPTVLQLRDKGLIIQSTQRDLKSYKKLIPAINKYPNAFIVTADDDIYYPHDWLKDLVAEYDADQRIIVGHRAHYINLDESGEPLPYLQWDFDTKHGGADRRVFLTSGGGVLYPPACFDSEIMNESAFLKICTLADDIWFYFMARKNGYVCKKIGSERFRIHNWRGSQRISLAASNVDNNLNDVQMKNMIEAYGNPLIY